MSGACPTFSGVLENIGFKLERDGDIQHVIEDIPVRPVDVEVTHEFLKVGFGPFIKHLMVMKFVPGGHVTLFNDRLTIRRDGEKTLRKNIGVEESIATAKSLGVSLDGERESQLRNFLTE